MEEWRAVVGYEGCYEVSNLGRVRTVERTVETYNGGEMFVAGIAKKQRMTGKGYAVVSLQHGKRKQTKRVHRLVARAFIPNPDGKQEVNHINGVKHDNRVANLEWCTSSENYKHAAERNLNAKPGKRIVMDGATVFYSIRSCAMQINACPKDVSLAVSGKRTSVHGHTFEPYNATLG